MTLIKLQTLSMPAFAHLIAPAAQYLLCAVTVVLEINSVVIVPRLVSALEPD